MSSRRTFLKSGLSSGVAAAAFPALALSAKTEVRYAEVEEKIARRDFRDLYKEELGTPAMVLDLDIFEKNIKKMADHSKATGLKIRPHCKIHKSPEITKRQQALGAIGVCCATIAEAELMVNAGIKGVLHTCQPAGINKISRAVALTKRDPSILFVADDPITATLLNEAAGVARVKVNLLVDIYAGLTRHGIAAGEPALKLAQQIMQSKNLKFSGLMGYSGGASHTHEWEKRRKQSAEDLSGLLETMRLCKKSGIPVDIATGGSTGTYNIDSSISGMTEIQAGSYIFMDTLYTKIGSKDGNSTFHDFEPSLAVLTTVISRNHPGQASIDCGNKALLKPTDEVKGRPDMVVENQGAEYGILKWKSGPDLKLGDRVEVYPSNLDMSTNVYDRYYVTRGERVVDVWSIMGRSGAVQR